MKKLSLLTIPLLALLLASCSSTPQSRIEKNPTLYNELSKEHQELVRIGQIDEGMTKPAVFLAMGKADRELVAVQKKNRLERWNYNTLQPVYHSGFSLGYGSGWGRRGYRGNYYGVGYSPSVAYVPTLGTSVYFENNKVTGWEGVRR